MKDLFVLVADADMEETLTTHAAAHEESFDIAEIGVDKRHVAAYGHGPMEALLRQPLRLGVQCCVRAGLVLPAPCGSGGSGLTVASVSLRYYEALSGSTP